MAPKMCLKISTYSMPKCKQGEVMSNRLLFISGSYPANQEGIADGAKMLLDSFTNNMQKDNLVLLTTNLPLIRSYLLRNETVRYELLDNWHIKIQNIKRIHSILNQYDINVIHMEYPGDCYGKTFLASFLPLFVKLYNLRYGKRIKFNVRLHEFTKARFLRKIAILPILMFSDTLYVPALFDREAVKKLVNPQKVKPAIIGTNIKIFPIAAEERNYKTVSYFGGVYPGKGIEHMLQIWKEVHKRDAKGKIRFEIIGEVNPNNGNHFSGYHKKVAEWLKKYELENVVKITGYISDQGVSHEIQKSDVATLLYEDGLTLRRGSFLAYLAHGVPVITTYADKESERLFKDTKGIAITNSDEEIINKIFEYCDISNNLRHAICDENKAKASLFDWNRIAAGMLSDYGILTSK